MDNDRLEHIILVVVPKSKSRFYLVYVAFLL